MPGASSSSRFAGPPLSALPTRPRIIATEGDVTAGALAANDAYDLKRLSAFAPLLLVAAAWGSCQESGTMKSFEAKWNELNASESATGECTRVEALQAFARDNAVRYSLAVFDARSGAPVPVATLDSVAANGLIVKITVAGQKEPLTWRPKDPANISVLLRE